MACHFIFFQLLLEEVEEKGRRSSKIARPLNKFDFACQNTFCVQSRFGEIKKNIVLYPVGNAVKNVAEISVIYFMHSFGKLF